MKLPNASSRVHCDSCSDNDADMHQRDKASDPWIFVEDFEPYTATFLKSFRKVLVDYASRDQESSASPVEICFLLQEAGCRQQQMHLDSIFPRKAFLFYFEDAASSTVFAAGPNVCTDINLVGNALLAYCCLCLLSIP